MAKPKWLKVGSLRKSQDKPDGTPGTLYIKVEADVSLKRGMSLSAQKPSDKFDRLLEKGMINADEHAEAVGKIPDYVKLDLYLAPNKD